MSLIMTQLFHDLRPNPTNRLPVIVSLLLLPVFGQQDMLAAKPAKVLYVTQSAAFAHPVLPHTEAVFERIATEAGMFEVTVTRDASTLTADTLSNYDAVVFFTTCELPMN